MQFARSLAQGHVVVSDLYSNTQVMTGDVLSGLGSSAAILYYNDTVTGTARRSPWISMCCPCRKRQVQTL